MPAFSAVRRAHEPLPEATRLGPVHLAVSSLKDCSAFYTRVLGLETLGGDGQGVSLGAGGRELLRLSLKPGARHYDGRSGLYHFCVAVEKRADFALLLRRVTDAGVPLQGLVDHHVAEAIYLPDPEGNGIELNWDRPRAQWPENMSVMMRMGNGPLDTQGLLDLASTLPPSPTLPPDARIGHVHLHVARLEACRDFYHGLLGFDVMGEFGRQAVFVSAGGYHHHVAFNIWNGLDAPPPPDDAGGLLWFSLVLPERASLEALLAKLKAAGQEAQRGEGGWLVSDPSGNRLLLTSEA